MRLVKLFEDFINEYNSVKGTEVWKHIKDITPNKEDIPNGFKQDIVKRKFKNVDDFDMKSLLKTDPDFKDYYDSGDERYDEDDVSPRDLSYEIVVVDGTLLDGYSRVSALLRNGEKTTNAYVAESLLSEGVHDKNILKAIFMAGGPGSGKSRVAKELFDIPEGGIQSISYSTGLKVINSDQAFEYELQKIGIDPKNLATMSPAEFDAVTQGEGSPRERAKKLTMHRQTLYMRGRLGMLIDGTGDDYKKIQTKKNLIEKLGYDTFMIFVNTSLEVALERNAARSRSLPEALVKEIWQAVQNNIGNFQTLFGSENIIIIDNSLSGTAHIKQMEGAIAKLLRKPLQNRIGKQWVKANS